MASPNGRGRPAHPDILTPAEWEVLDCIRHGMGNRTIAGHRGTSVDASKFHVANILDKLGLSKRAELRHWIGCRAESGARSQTNGGHPMEPTKLGPIGQVSINTDDVERATRFFRDVLGIPHLFTFGDLAFFDCDGTRLFLSGSDEGREPGNSVIYFSVPDIHAAYDDLVAKDVPFEGAPHHIHTHEDGTEEWMAFFRDPDGNLLALMSRVKGSQPPP